MFALDASSGILNFPQLPSALLFLRRMGLWRLVLTTTVMGLLPALFL